MPQGGGQQTGFQGGQAVRYLPGGGYVPLGNQGGGGGQQDPFTSQRQAMGGFINNPGQAMTDFQQTLPQVQPLQYGSGAWNLGDLLQQAQPSQSTPPPQMNITAGIPAQPMQMPQQPQAMGMPDQQGMSPMQQQAAQASFGQAAQPQLAQLLSQYYPAAAGLQDASQQAQAASGLGWAGLGSTGFNQAAGNQVAQNSQLLRFLQGAQGIMG